MEHFQYSPVIETSGMPEAVQKRLATAGVELWKAAQAEAAMVWQSERLRYEEALQAERELRNEAMAMLDARDLTIEHQRDQLTWYVTEHERLKEHLQAVRADAFWDRVVREIWAILPERDALNVEDITNRIGADLVEEAKSHREEWKPATIRKKLDTRIYHKRLFAKEGRGRYRRRRPEDDAA